MFLLLVRHLAFGLRKASQIATLFHERAIFDVKVPTRNSSRPDVGSSPALLESAHIFTYYLPFSIVNAVSPASDHLGWLEKFYPDPRSISEIIRTHGISPLQVYNAHAFRGRLGWNPASTSEVDSSERTPVSRWKHPHGIPTLHNEFGASLRYLALYVQPERHLREKKTIRWTLTACDVHSKTQDPLIPPIMANWRHSGCDY